MEALDFVLRGSAHITTFPQALESEGVPYVVATLDHGKLAALPRLELYEAGIPPPTTPEGKRLLISQELFAYLDVLAEDARLPDENYIVLGSILHALSDAQLWEWYRDVLIAVKGEAINETRFWLRIQNNVPRELLAAIGI
jgi:hypothetical protein